MTGAFPTVTTTAVVPTLFAASRASAVTVCGPSLTSVVSHTTSYGGTRSSAPRFTPSTLNCTPTTPTSSLAVAVISTVPVTVPAAGLVSVTAGGAPSADGTKVCTVC